MPVFQDNANSILALSLKLCEGSKGNRRNPPPRSWLSGKECLAGAIDRMGRTLRVMSFVAAQFYYPPLVLLTFNANFRTYIQRFLIFPRSRMPFFHFLYCMRIFLFSIASQALHYLPWALFIRVCLIGFFDKCQHRIGTTGKWMRQNGDLSLLMSSVVPPSTLRGWTNK